MTKKYLLKLWDGKEIIVPANIAEPIQSAKQSRKDGVFKWKGGTYDIKAVSYIEPVMHRETEFVLPEKIERPVSKETLAKVNAQIKNKFGESN